MASEKMVCHKIIFIFIVEHYEIFMGILNSEDKKKEDSRVTTLLSLIVGSFWGTKSTSSTASRNPAALARACLPHPSDAVPLLQQRCSLVQISVIVLGTQGKSGF